VVAVTQPAEITSRADWALLTQNLREFNEQIDALYLRITDPGDDAEPSDGETEDPGAEPETSATAQPEPDDVQPQEPQHDANPSETEEPVSDPDQATDPFAEAENAELERRQQLLDADAYDNEVEQDVEDQRRLDYESDGDLDGDYDPDLGVDG
jgi:hypothetical protein